MINYINGDLFKGIENSKEKILIPHIVNNIGAWGSGFVIPLGRKFPEAKQDYLNLLEYTDLGECIFSHVKNIVIANMVAQNGISSKSTGNRNFVSPNPIRYGALLKCMEEIAIEYPTHVIHTPKFGSLRAGGNWALIEELIKEIWYNHTVNIYVFEE